MSFFFLIFFYALKINITITFFFVYYLFLFLFLFFLFNVCSLEITYLCVYVCFLIFLLNFVSILIESIYVFFCKLFYYLIFCFFSFFEFIFEAVGRPILSFFGSIMTQLPTFPFEIALKNQLGSNLGEWEDKPVENYYLIILGFLSIAWFYFTAPLLTQEDESPADLGDQDIEVLALRNVNFLLFGLNRNHLQDYSDFSEDVRSYDIPVNRLTSFRETKYRWDSFLKHKKVRFFDKKLNRFSKKHTYFVRLKRIIKPLVSKKVFNYIINIFYKKSARLKLFRRSEYKRQVDELGEKNKDKKIKELLPLVKKIASGKKIQNKINLFIKKKIGKRNDNSVLNKRGIYLSQINEIVGRLSKLKRKEKQQLMDILFNLGVENNIRNILGEEFRIKKKNVNYNALLEYKAMLILLHYIDEFFFLQNFMEEIFEAEGDLYFDFNVKQKEWSNPQIDFDFGLFFRYSVIYPIYSVILCLLPYSIIELLFFHKDGSRSFYNLFRSILYVPFGILFILEIFFNTIIKFFRFFRNFVSLFLNLFLFFFLFLVILYIIYIIYNLKI
jgi:hypothetical protein